MKKLFLVLSLVVACESEIGPTPPAATLGLSGRVVTPNGNSIPNADVTVNLLRGRSSVPACSGDDVAGPQFTRTGSTGSFFVKLVDYDMVADSLCVRVRVASLGEVTVAIPHTRFRLETRVNAAPQDTLDVVLVFPPG